jgi:superfamily II DNA/RNA helicase
MELLKILKSGKNLAIHSDMHLFQTELPKLLHHFVPNPEEGSPRMLVICPNDDIARSTEELLQEKVKELDLTMDLITDKGNSLKQRNDLFFGTEVIVGSIKKTNAMYLQNGFNVALLKCCVVLEIDEIIKKGMRGHLVRIAESLPKKCAYAIQYTNEDSRIEEFIEVFAPNHSTRTL